MTSPVSLVLFLGLGLAPILFAVNQVPYGVGMGPNETATAPGSTTTTPGPFLNLSNTTWTMYNESSGSTSTLKFNDSGTYTRTLHGNNITGIWSSSVVTAQQLQLCPSEQKWTSGCLLAILRVESPNHAEFMDKHGDRIHLMR